MILEIENILNFPYSLAQLIRCVGDSGEIETKDNQSRIDLVQRDTQNQLTKLSSTVERLRNVLMSADKLKLEEVINEAEQEADQLEKAKKEKTQLEAELGQVSAFRVFFPIQ